jgi:ribonuclease BN (tRNA processing enzyme)
MEVRENKKIKNKDNKILRESGGKFGVDWQRLPKHAQPTEINRRIYYHEYGMYFPKLLGLLISVGLSPKALIWLRLRAAQNF